MTNQKKSNLDKLLESSIANRISPTTLEDFAKKDNSSELILKELCEIMTTIDFSESVKLMKDFIKYGC